MSSHNFDHETVTRLRQVAAEDAAAAHGHNQASRPGVMERVRRAVRTPLGRVAVVAGGAVLATGAALGLAQSGGHGGGHEVTHRPAAVAEHPHHHAVATKPNTVTLDKEKGRFQAASLAAGRTIVKDIAQSPIGAPYKQVYVGVYPGQAQSPEMFSEWDPKTDTMYVSSITQPDGSGVDKFNNVAETFKITGASAVAMNKATKEGPLQVSNFEAALSDPANVEAVSVQVQTPKSDIGGTTMTVNAAGVMAEAPIEGLNSTTVTNANAPTVVEPFISELRTTTDVLQQAYRTYEQ